MNEQGNALQVARDDPLLLRCKQAEVLRRSFSGLDCSHPRMAEEARLNIRHLPP
jgi:hypothetical protein